MQEQETPLKLEIQDFESLDDLYASIDENGSLGLLALGALGLTLWRKKREEIQKTKPVQLSDEAKESENNG